ncbi:LLM class flavin-dependent oxidoreductase [Acidovorax sp. CCYZU-2555]|uniref:LLM class flavin-dependent oxidoreductase n=1 Tax=Acidovorax sp. CCYZU-2555 TaxID=2835042 RepID=UPI001BCD48E8|nr:LLM class flavin-dependent oxidoreductase [Acidovorax sp. CCYZU-2555]MBS7780009.1 LLM class flavin-dependent oxidoreductase [Acidovorax sp. CCYZU-2555]
MSERIILDLSGPALEAATAVLAAGGERAAALGRALDQLPVAAFSVGFATPASHAKDGTVFAAFLLAFTRRSRVVVRVDPARQHPINIARTVSTLSALHGARIGIGLHADAQTDAWFARATDAASAADYLRLVSSLWDSWPLDAIIGDTHAGRYVDAQRIVRIADPAYAHIGGPLTLPTDGASKPPLLLLQAQGGEGGDLRGVDLALQSVSGNAYAAAGLRLVLGEGDLQSVLAWAQSTAYAADGAGLTLRAALGLGASGQVATASTPVFGDPSGAALV